MDWTFDLYLNDVENSFGFGGKVKEWASQFTEEWNITHEHQYDNVDGYIGDAFVNTLDCFSDWYKDEYGQRPHLPWWFYIHPLGLPMHEDTSRLFCIYNPIKSAAEEAKEKRESF